MPLYLSGARMLANYPTSIVVHGLALNITVQSYAGALDFGMMADAAAMPDVKSFAQAVEIAFDDLHALSSPDEQRANEQTPSALVDRAVRSVSTRVERAVKDAVGGAVTSAVNQAVRGAMRTAAGAARRAAPADRAAAPAKKNTAVKRAATRKTGKPAAPRARRGRHRGSRRCR